MAGPHAVWLAELDRPAQEVSRDPSKLEDWAAAPLELWREGRPVAELAGWLDEVSQLVRTEQGLEDFALLIRYIHHTADFAPGSLRQLVRGLGRRVEDNAMTAAERLKAEGKAEGIAQGMAEGQAQLLLKLLTLRFGALPPHAQTRVAEASLDQLAVYGERVLSAASLDDVLK